MKNARIQPLILLTGLFPAFIVGFFAGRNINREPLHIEYAPKAAVTSSSTATETSPTESAIVNINTATSEQLQTLPNIGPKIAAQIIAYRDEHGIFESVGELMNIPGIGEKKLEAIWDMVTTGG